MSKKTEVYSMIASGLGLFYDGANDVLHGQREGFDLIIYAANANYPFMLSIHTSAKSSIGASLTKDEIKELTKGVKPISSFQQTGNSFVANLCNEAKPEKLVENVMVSVNAMLSFLKNKGYYPCCGLCEQQAELSAYRTAGTFYHLCTDCSIKMQSNITMSVHENQQKSENVVGGFVGALIGSLVGVLVIVLLSQLGYVAAISGVVMAVGVLKGYELLGGKLTKKGIVISVVIMLLMTYIGDQIDWALRLFTQGGGKEEGFTLFECYRLVGYALEEEIIDAAAYYGNLVMLYMFLLLGAIPTIISKVKEKKDAVRMIKIGSVGDYGVYNQ
ncbi:MAG: hypothetical protein ACI4HQ_00070 [Acetatifactor sp.]